jgi:hypothetical protein
MRRFKIPEIAIGFGLGVIFFLFVAAVTSYQTEHCRQQNQTSAKEPSADQPIKSPKASEARNQEPSDYGRKQPISCGISGIVPAAFGFMDEHEGTFVGSFTGLLFIATLFLWLTTSDLAQVGERIGHAQVRAYVDIISAEIIFASIAEGIAPAHDVQPFVKIVAKNTGQSPARNFIWNPTVKCFGIGAETKGIEAELGSNWREIRGIGISATNGEYGDGAIVPILLGKFLTESGSNQKFVLVNLRVQFEYDDVFDVKITDEIYFSGGFIKDPAKAVQTNIGVTEWIGNLSRINRPNDLPSHGKPS